MPITDEESKRAADAIAAAFASSGPPETIGATAQVSLGDAKRVFCEHWETAKQVLKVLGSIFPPANIVIGPVILAGDAAHRAICDEAPKS